MHAYMYAGTCASRGSFDACDDDDGGDGRSVATKGSSALFLRDGNEPRRGLEIVNFVYNIYWASLVVY